MSETTIPKSHPGYFWPPIFLAVGFILGLAAGYAFVGRYDAVSVHGANLGGIGAVVIYDRFTGKPITRVYGISSTPIEPYTPEKPKE